MSHFFGFSCIVAICCAPCVARAGTDVPQVPDLALRVEAPRARASLLTDSTAAHSTLDSQLLTQPGATPAELLGQLPGVHCLESGPGAGNYSTYFVRGASATQSQIYLQDIPLGRSGRTPDLQALPFALMDRVELYRSVTPVGLGVNSLGGAMVLVPVQATARHVRLGIGAGSYESAEAWGHYTDSWPIADHSAGARIQGTRGDFSYRNDMGTGFDSSDDRTQLRQNNWNESASGIYQLQLRPAAHHTLTLLNYSYYNRGGMPGNGLHQATHTTRATLQQVNGLSYHYAHAGYSVRLRGYFEHLRDRQRDLLQEFGARPNDSDNRTHVYGAGVDGIVALTHWMDLASALQYEWESYRPRDPLNPGPQLDSARHNLTAGLQPELRIAPAHLRIVPTLQWHYSYSTLAQQSLFATTRGLTETQHAEPIARLGLAYQPHPALELVSNLARGTRLPTFTELFGDGATLIPSQELQPEASLTGDIGVRTRLVRARHTVHGEVFGFYTRQRNTIQYTRATRDTWIAQNVEGATLRGLELGLTADLWTALRTRTSVNILDARQISNRQYYADKRLALRPPLTAYGQAMGYRRFGTWLTLEAGPSLSYQSANYVDPANRVLVPSRLLWDAELSALTLADRLRARAVVRNLTDQSVFDFTYYPLPGRNYYVTVEATLL